MIGRKLGFKFPHNSIRFKLTISVLIMTLPLVGMLIYNNFYAIDVVRSQVADSYSNTLSLYMNQIDSDLSDIDSYINSLARNGYDLISLKLAETDDQYYLAKSHIFNKLMDDIALYKTLDSFFVYVADRQDYMDVYSTGVTFIEREQVQEHVEAIIVQRLLPQGNRTKRWQHIQIGQEHYLINIVQSGDVYIGGWIKADDLLRPLLALRLGEGGTALIANDKGEPITNQNFVEEYGIELRYENEDYYISGLKQKYLVVGTESYRGNFNLVALIPDRNILSNLPYLQQLIWFVTVGVIIFIPMGLYYISRTFLAPLKRILQAMSRVRGGDWSVRVQSDKDAEEFHILGRSFNTMMSEIEMLRVNVYEEQLNKQREELQRLQLQVNPHFFLNSLNIVYNLAKVKNYRLIMEMTRALMLYFRFLFRSNTSFVKLADELEHTRNYLNIQTLRFPDKLSWSVNAPDYLSDIPIPPLVIQSFVENSIKHAVTMEESVHIAVHIILADDEDQSRIRILIRDTGRGFDDDVLHKLQAGLSVENERGEHTGIWNVQRRINLLYREAVHIRYYNDENKGGAVVELNLPIQPAMKSR